MVITINPFSQLAESVSPIAIQIFVIAMIGVDNENNKYVVDIFRERINPSLQPKKIIDYYKKYKPRRVKVETTGYQEALRTGTRELMREEDLYIPGLEAGVKPRTKKSERLLSLVPMFARKQFHFRPEDIAAQQEFLSYPKGQHDDVMDAIWTALEGAKPCRVSEEDFDPNIIKENKIKKILDWMTM